MNDRYILMADTTTQKRGRGRPRKPAAAKQAVKQANNARYYEDNKDVLKAKGQAYEAAHKDERKDANAKYHADNRDAHNASMKARYEANKDEINRKKREARTAKNLRAA